MARGIAPCSKPSAVRGKEDEFSDGDFALTCLVDATPTTSTRVGSPQTMLNTSGYELYNVLTLLTTTRPRTMVRELPDQNGSKRTEASYHDTEPERRRRRDPAADQHPELQLW